MYRVVRQLADSFYNGAEKIEIVEKLNDLSFTTEDVEMSQEPSDCCPAES